jgi:hypothetical protein
MPSVECGAPDPEPVMLKHKLRLSLRASAPPRAPLASTSVFHLCFICGLFTFLSLLTGCHGLFRGPPGGARPIENPLFLPPIDRELLWNQTIDAVDDYFRVEREDRVRLIGGILTEGRIDTFPTVGSTLFEPWRTDSTPGYEKLHATLQSIRRRGTIRVIPAEGGYLLDVVVQKELEDLDKPEHATAGGATLRHDGTLVRQETAPGRYSVTLGWIPIGRDVTLEQRILADVSARLDVGHGGHSPTFWEEMFSPAIEGTGPELRPALPADSALPETLPPPLHQLPPLP